MASSASPKRPDAPQPRTRGQTTLASRIPVRAHPGHPVSPRVGQKATVADLIAERTPRDPRDVSAETSAREGPPDRDAGESQEKSQSVSATAGRPAVTVGWRRCSGSFVRPAPAAPTAGRVLRSRPSPRFRFHCGDWPTFGSSSAFAVRWLGASAAIRRQRSDVVGDWHGLPYRAHMVTKSRAHDASKKVSGPRTAVSRWPLDGVARPWSPRGW